MGLSIPFYTEQYRWFWWQYKLSFKVYRKHCNRDAMIRNSVYNTTWSQVESPLLVLWQSHWLCLSCPLTSTWYGLLAVTGTTTRSGWIMQGGKKTPLSWTEEVASWTVNNDGTCRLLYYSVSYALPLIIQWHKN
jgi:hypothetical protein